MAKPRGNLPHIAYYAYSFETEDIIDNFDSSNKENKFIL